MTMNAAVFIFSGSGRKLTHSAEKEQQLVEWVLKQTDIHLPIAVQSLMDKAAETIATTNSSFKASRQKFICRNDLIIRTKTTIVQKLLWKKE